MSEKINQQTNLEDPLTKKEGADSVTSIAGENTQKLSRRAFLKQAGLGAGVLVGFAGDKEPTPSQIEADEQKVQAQLEGIPKLPSEKLMDENIGVGDVAFVMLKLAGKQVPSVVINTAGLARIQAPNTSLSVTLWEGDIGGENYPKASSNATPSDVRAGSFGPFRNIGLGDKNKGNTVIFPLLNAKDLQEEGGWYDNFQQDSRDLQPPIIIIKSVDQLEDPRLRLAMEFSPGEILGGPDVSRTTKNIKVSIPKLKDFRTDADTNELFLEERRSTGIIREEEPTAPEPFYDNLQHA